MIRRRGFLKGLAAAVPLGMAAVIPRNRPPRPDPRTDPAAFCLDLEPFRQVDPALLHYREEAPLAEGLEGAAVLALSADGILHAAVGRRVWRFTAGDRTAVVDAERTVTAAAIVANDGLWVASGARIDRYDQRGRPRGPTVDLGERGYVTGLAVDGGRVFAADAGQRTVWVLSDDGRLTGRIDGRASGDGGAGFVVPSPWFAVAWDGDALWVVNPGRQRVERYEDGRRVGSWGTAAMAVEGFCGCCNPTHLALLPGGGFVTSEKGICRVKVYDPEGRLRSVVAGPGAFTDGTTGLDLAVLADGRILVLDPVRGQVRCFVRERTT